MRLCLQYRLLSKYRCNSFERSQEDLFNDSLCDPPPQGYEDEGGSKILKDIRTQIKNLGTLMMFGFNRIGHRLTTLYEQILMICVAE